MSEGCKASPGMKERGCQEAIAMAAKFQNPTGGKQSSTVVTQEEVGSSQSAKVTEMNNTRTSDDSIEDRQQKRQRVLEQFLREARRKGELTATYESKLERISGKSRKQRNRS